MLWIVFIAGMFVGANIGVVVSCIVISAKKRDTMVHQHNHQVEYAIMDELTLNQRDQLNPPHNHLQSGHKVD